MITDLSIQNSSSTKKQTIPSKVSSAALDYTRSSKSFLRSRVFGYWSKLSLRHKATILAVAVSVVPIAVVGSVAYNLASQSLMRQIFADQESRTFELRQKVTLYANQTISDATTIAQSPLLSDPQLRQATTIGQKAALLNDYIDANQQKYDSIAVFDRSGNLLFQSKSTQPLNPQENYSNREYFQRAIATGATAVNNPDIAPSSGESSLEVATPIKEKGTGVILGVVRVRMPLARWKQIFQYSQIQGLEHNLISSKGRIFVADEPEVIGQDAGIDFTDVPLLQAKVQTQIENGNKAANIIESGIMVDRNDQEKVVVSLASIPDIAGILEPGWQISLSRPIDEAFAPLRQLRMTMLLGTSVAALFVGSLAAFLANRVTLPILAAAGAVKKIGRGDLNARLEVQGDDELAMLGTDINKMAKQLKSLVVQKEIETRRSQLLKDVTLKLAEAIDSEAVFQIAVEEIISILRVDRGIIYLREASNRGKIIAEAVRDDRISRLQPMAAQLNYLDEYLIVNQTNKVRAISNLYQTNLTLPHLRQLEAFEIKSELSAPLFIGHKLQGFLVVHQCDRSRTWQQAEIDFFAQLTSQVMLALERTNLLLEQKTAKEQLQQQAIELLMEIAPISQGDLTVRATVADGEIGTLADSYNSTVESLRQIVIQVQKSITQMAGTTKNNGEIAQTLSERAAQESTAIAHALEQIQTMAESIGSVAFNAEQVEAAFQEVSDTVAVGNMGMERTVEGIFAIRQTVAETAKKVKRLGESSQKIFKVVNLINSFADRTNLLALNASLETNRSSHEEQNFGVVAEEIQTLARQSAQATTEIEKLVSSIQLDIREVATAMEQGTEQVVAGTQLVDQTRQKLHQIAASSTVVGDRLKQITLETVQQSQASQQISKTIAEVATMATTTYTDAMEVSASTQELLDITHQLQTSANKFKV